MIQILLVAVVILITATAVQGVLLADYRTQLRGWVRLAETVDRRHRSTCDTLRRELAAARAESDRLAEAEGILARRLAALQQHICGVEVGLPPLPPASLDQDEAAAWADLAAHWSETADEPGRPA